MDRFGRTLCHGLLSWMLGAPAWGAALSEEELFFKSVADVNEGELRFLAQAPASPVHHHQNLIVLTEASLDTGWARLEQCHSHMDAVPSSQIAYNAERTRAIRVTRVEHIGRAWVEGNTVQLAEVGRDATLCVQAQTRALERDGQGGYQLRNGPYMRRFLDGYYPMRVSLVVRVEAPDLRFSDIDPPPQPGFTVKIGPGEIGYDAWFEGRLSTLIRFTRKAP